jgi:hypothetical protein
VRDGDSLRQTSKLLLTKRSRGIKDRESSEKPQISHNKYDNKRGEFERKEELKLENL